MAREHLRLDDIYLATHRWTQVYVGQRRPAFYVGVYGAYTRDPRWGSGHYTVYPGDFCRVDATLHEGANCYYPTGRMRPHLRRVWAPSRVLKDIGRRF